MNYQHAYHTGNFADVLKHLVLCDILQALLKKNTPFFVMDTHAGAALYDLQAEAPQKTLEFQQGIALLWAHLQTETKPAAITRYLELVGKVQPLSSLEFAKSSPELAKMDSPLLRYPGSSLLTLLQLRPVDRLVACELHPAIFETLKQQVYRWKKTQEPPPTTQLHHLDGYQALKAFLPPKENRGVVLIDPPFEDKQEWEHCISHLLEASLRWPNGIFLVWYPIKSQLRSANHLDFMKKKLNRPWLQLEWRRPKPTAESRELNATGLFIVNPPWQLREEVQTWLPWVTTVCNCTPQWFSS